MIIVPEKQIVVITPPRTGSTSLLHTIRNIYPLTMSPYRHMEADGIPLGYDRWERIAIVRHPMERLWSLYKYIRNLPELNPQLHLHSGEWQAIMRDSAQMDFDTWLIEGMVPFTHPYWMGTNFDPRYHVRHPMPEQRKSQWAYVRPDLGTKYYLFEEGGLAAICRHLEIGSESLKHVNVTEESKMPTLLRSSYVHYRQNFAWERSLGYSL